VDTVHRMGMEIETRECGHSQGPPQFFGYLYLVLTQEQVKAIKKFGEEGAWAYPGTAQICWVPPII